MSGFDKISPGPKGRETKLGEMTRGESGVLQFPLALLMYNRKRQKEGLLPISLDPIHASELETGENESDKSAALREERRLQREAFFQWADENSADKLSQRFREYIDKHPEQKIDLNNPTDIGTLFEFMFPPHSIQEQSKDVERAFAQDLM